MTYKSLFCLIEFHTEYNFKCIEKLVGWETLNTPRSHFCFILQEDNAIYIAIFRFAYTVCICFCMYPYMYVYVCVVSRA